MRAVRFIVNTLVVFLMFLSVAYASDGVQKWTVSMDDKVEAAAAMSTDGVIYVGSIGGYLYAIDSINGFVKWKFYTGGGIFSAPLVAPDGTVYIGSWSGKLYALTPGGSKKWEFAASYAITSSPTISKDGTIYVGSYDGYLYAIDSSNGQLKWKFKTDGRIYSSVAIAKDGTLYFGSEDGYLYALNPDGTLKWKFNTGAAISGSPAIDLDGTIYIGTNDPVNALFAITPDGAFKWKFDADGGVASGVAIGYDGSIYLGTMNGTFYALYPNGSLRWKFSTESKVATTSTATDSSTSVTATESQIHSTPLVGNDGTIYFGCSNGYLYAVKQDGTLKWKFITGKIMYASPVMDANGVVYIGSDSDSFYAIDTESGSMAASAWPKFKHDMHNYAIQDPFSDISTPDYFWAKQAILDLYMGGVVTGYPDGTYKPYRDVKRDEIAAFIARAAHLNIQDCVVSPFVDVPVDSWYCEFVQALKNADIVSGYPDGTYAPENPVKRSEMAKILAKSLNLPVQPCFLQQPFYDVPISSWYCEYVKAIKEKGITTGYPDGSFRPNNTVTRAQMAVFADRAFFE